MKLYVQTCYILLLKDSRFKKEMHVFGDNVVDCFIFHIFKFDMYGDIVSKSITGFARDLSQNLLNSNVHLKRGVAQCNVGL